MQSTASKQKINELRIQELAAKQAHSDDKLNTVTKEVSEMSTNVHQLQTTVQAGFGRLESLLRQGQTNAAPTQQAAAPAAAAPVAAAAAMEERTGQVAAIAKTQGQEPVVCFYETPTFWGSGMLGGATSYDEQAQGVYSYGQADFFAQ